MTKLTALRARLTELRRRRQLARWGTAYAGLGLAVLWTLAVVSAVDIAFEMSKPQRLLILLVSACVVVWAVRRFTLPWLGQRETDLDMALLVERQQKIDSDLVAALQFETAEAGPWGSAQLQQAVVDYVAEFGKSWDIFGGFSRRELTRRAGLLAATVCVLGLTVLAAPRYAATFLDRFFLGSAHYPTNTVIDRVLVNRQEVDFKSGAEILLKAPYGQPLKFEVRTSGEIPPHGRADLRTLTSGLETRVDLEAPGKTAPREASAASESLPQAGPQDEPAPQERPSPGNPGRARGEAVFVGQLPKVVDSLTYQLYLGDAWTDPVRVVVVPLPVIEPKLTPTPPNYARGADAEVAEGSRQISVIEGSRVELQITCRNKRLQQAWLTIDEVKYGLTRAKQQPESGEVWTLNVENTPLVRVEKPACWELQVVDEDELQLEHPVQGCIRIKADQRPRISADVVTKSVLPTASPLIEYRASDDYGIGNLLIHLQASRADGSVQELPTLAMRDLRQPILSDKLPLKDVYRLEISPLKLVKGDQLKVVLEAVDYRGTSAGESAFSEPLLLQVTDESGVLAAISESDERSARQLDAIITRQLGIGDSK